jgi:hypothetical protein
MGWSGNQNRSESLTGRLVEEPSKNCDEQSQLSYAQKRSSTTTQQKAVMTYQIEGSNVSLSLSADEMNEVIEALELAGADSELLEAWQEFRKEEFA